ncbi:MAG: TolC family protein [Flavobacteriaceae bacterium]|jgi:outer membrane protein|nr:TolC family protein [Flavobacteriaceae bacterium]
MEETNTSIGMIIKKVLVILFLGFSIGTMGQGSHKWTLEECISYAKENSLEIKRKLYDVELANNNIQLKNSSQYPTINSKLNSDYTPNFKIENRSYNRFSNNTGIEVIVPIYEGNRMNIEKDIARVELELANTGIEVEKFNIEQIVLNEFFNIVLNKELLNVYKNNIEYSTKVLEQTRKKYDAGISSKADIAQSESELASISSKLKETELNIKNLLFKLARILQVDDYRVFDIMYSDKDKYSDIEISSLEESIVLALQNREQLKYSEIRKEIYNKNIELLKTKVKPKVYFNYNLTTSYIDLLNSNLKSNPFSTQLKDNISNVFSVSMVIPIFNKTNKININRAYIESKVAQNEYDILKKDISDKVTNAYIEIENAKVLLDTSKKNLEYSKLAFDYAFKSYNEGVISIYEYNRVQNEYIQVQSRVIQSEYSLLWKQKNLKLLIY